MNEILQKLREPLPEHLINWLPKGGTKLAYAGHAAITDRLLTADPAWTWEPLAFDAEGLPRLDKDGGLWIRLTVGGVTRLGYGDAGQKKGPDAMKERIGDALRNGAMRFGVGLELWHKGDLHREPDPDYNPRDGELEELALTLIDLHEQGNDIEAVRVWYDPATWDKDHITAEEERLRVWGMLKGTSKLRSTIKANLPERLAKKAEAAA